MRRSKREKIDFQAVNRAAIAVLPTLLRRWLPEGRIEGREYLAHNPTRTDRQLGSFKINLKTGKWADFASGDKGGDAISLVADLRGIKQSEAARGLAAMLGVDMPQ